jgi:glycosyltransferase involved in cell wall biosynthesis
MRKTDNFITAEMQINELLQQNSVKLFIAIGRFCFQKNFIMLSELFNKLEQQKKNVVLIIIGGNPDEEEQKAEIEHIKKIKSKNTFLLGSKVNIGDYLLNSDVLILSSRFEGMPIVVLEALSIGMPIVSTPAGGVKDIVKNKINGFIADGFDVENLYQAVLSFLELSPEEETAIKLENLKLFQAKYDIRVCSQKYISLYEDLLNIRKNGMLH